MYYCKFIFTLLYFETKTGKKYIMDNMPLSLFELSPQEATFSLSGENGKTFTLCRWSLRVRAWASSKYTNEGLKQIFTEQKITEIAEMAFFMLKEKDQFKTQDDFFDAIVTIQDQINIIMALLKSIGIGEPEIQKINDSLPKETPAPPKAAAPIQAKPKIGAKSLTR